MKGFKLGSAGESSFLVLLAMASESGECFREEPQTRPKLQTHKGPHKICKTLLETI